jgi:hypothetical protein
MQMAIIVIFILLLSKKHWMNAIDIKVVISSDKAIDHHTMRYTDQANTRYRIVINRKSKKFE